MIGRENRFGAEWRKNLVHSQHFSRTKWVIPGLQSYAIKYGISKQAAVDSLEPTYKEFNCSLYNFFSLTYNPSSIIGFYSNKAIGHLYNGPNSALKTLIFVGD